MKRKINSVCLLNPQGFVTYPPPLGKIDTGGQTLYVLQLAKALAEKGIKVDIFVRKFDELSQNETPWPKVNIIRIPCGNTKFVNKEKLYELMPEFTEEIMFYIEKKRKKYNVIHSHYWDGGYAGTLLSKMLDIPHIHTPHSLGKLKKLEMSIEEVPVKKLKPMYRYHVRIAIEQKILNKVNAIVVICETSRIQILQHYLVDFEKLHVIFPGIESKIYNPKKTKYDKLHPLKANAILVVSRLVPAKGIDRVIEALRYLKKRVPFHLYIAGGTVDNQLSKEEAQTKELINRLSKKYHLKNRIEFFGYVNHDTILPAIYRNADVFILAGRYEPFGLTTLEAMACGTVPIVSKIAGSREVIIDGLNGYILNTGNRKALAERLYKLLTNTKRRRKIAENAAFTIKEHYSWSKIATKIIKLYSRM